jgi:hypothetical protein
MLKTISDKYFKPVVVAMIIIAAVIIINRWVQFFDTRSAIGYVLLALLLLLCVIAVIFTLYKINSNLKSKD